MERNSCHTILKVESATALEGFQMVQDLFEKIVAAARLMGEDIINLRSALFDARRATGRHCVGPAAFHVSSLVR